MLFSSRMGTKYMLWSGNTQCLSFETWTDLLHSAKRACQVDVWHLNGATTCNVRMETFFFVHKTKLVKSENRCVALRSLIVIGFFLWNFFVMITIVTSKNFFSFASRRENTKHTLFYYTKKKRKRGHNFFTSEHINTQKQPKKEEEEKKEQMSTKSKSSTKPKETCAALQCRIESLYVLNWQTSTACVFPSESNDITVLWESLSWSIVSQSSKQPWLLPETQ